MTRKTIPHSLYWMSRWGLSFTEGLMLIYYQASVLEDDDSELQTDFEVVPQELDDAEMWDVNDPNEDGLKASQIKSTIFVYM